MLPARVATWLGCAALSAFFCGSAAWLSPRLPTLDPSLGYALAFAAVSAEILAVGLCTPVLSNAVLALLCVGLGTGLFALVGVSATPLSLAGVTVLLLPLVTALGAKLGSRIERAGHLLAVCLVSSLADLWSVFDSAGPSARLAQRVLERPDEVTVFALGWPMLGTPVLPPLIGAGDVLFVALYLAAFRAHELSVWRAAAALAAGFATGLALVIGLERAVPLLPLLGLFVVAAEPRTRSLAPREQRSVWVASAVLAVAILARVLR